MPSESARALSGNSSRCGWNGRRRRYLCRCCAACCDLPWPLARIFPKAAGCTIATMAKLVALLSLLLVVAGCGKKPAERFALLSQEFVYTTLSFSPSAATAAGLHKYQDRTLDGMLDDLSPSSIERQHNFYLGFRERLERLKPDDLSAEDRADWKILEDQISLALLDFDEIQNYMHNPATYVETLGNALFTPYVLEYAPKSERR